MFGLGEGKGTRGTDPSGAVASVRFWSVTRGAIGTDPSGAVASREGINPGDELAGNDPPGSVDLSIKRQPNRFRIMLSAGWLPVAAVNSRSRADAMLPEARLFFPNIYELAKGRGIPKGGNGWGNHLVSLLSLSS